MKKLILPLLLVVSFLFAGFNKAGATVTVKLNSYNTPGSNGLATSPIASGSTNIPIYGFNLTGTGTGTRNITQLVFYNSGVSPGFNNVFFTTAYLYTSTSATYVPGVTNVAGNLISTYTANGSYNLTFNVTIAVTSASNLYYFIVLSNTLNTTAVDFECDYNGNTGGGTFTTSTQTTGYDYTFSAPAAVTATAASLTTTAGSNGLSTPATIGTAGNYTVYGMSLTPSAAGTTKALTGLTFTTSGAPSQFNNYFYGTAYLYASNNSSFDGTAVQISTVNTAGNNTLAFTGFTTAQSITAGTTKYYYVVIVYSTGVAATATQTLTLTGTTSTATVTITGGAAAGPSYTYNPLPAVTATAASLTTTAGSNGLSTPATISAAANYTVYGMSLTPSATGVTKALTGLTFTTTGAPSQFNNYFYGTAYLYASNNSSFDGTAVQISTVTTAGNNTLSFTGFTTAQNITAGTTKYYYVVIVYNTGVAATATQTITYSSATSTATVTAGASVAGPSYTYNPPPFILTLNSLTTTAGNNGLSGTPVAYGSTNYSVYGFNLAGAGGAGSTTINSITFNQNGTSTDFNNLYYTTAYLYSCTTNNFGTGTKTLVATTTSTNSNSIVFTPGTAISATNTTNTYYFIVLSNTLGDNNALTFKLTYASSTIGSGTAITSGASVSGPAYTFAAQPKTTVTFNSIGASGANPTNGLVANPISTFQTNMALEGFTLTGSGTGATETVTSITFARGDFDVENNNDFFPTLTLYSSTSATFPGVGGSGVSGPLGSVTLGANQNNFTITPTTALTVTSSTTPALYYFLVASYTTLGTTYAGNTYEIDEYGVTTGSGNAININNQYGYDYTFTAPTVTATDITAGLSPVPPANVYQGQSGLAIAGVGLSVSLGTSSLTSLVFSDSQNRTTAALYFATPQLYVSTSPTFSLTTGTIATLVTATATIATGGNVTFAITGQTISSTPLYYYMVVNYSVTGGATPLTFQFAPYSYNVAVNGGSVTTGFSSNSYTCAPNVYVTASSINGFSPTTIVSANTGLGIFGFALSSYPANTFTTFNFTSTGTMGNISTYFTNLQLYSSTTNDFTTATPVAAGYTVSTLNATSFSISGLSQSLTNSTVYYFIVLDCTGVPTTGTATFTPTLSSVTTSTAVTYSTAANGFTVTGQTYTLQPPVTATYYWTGNGTNSNWDNPANWQTNQTRYSYVNTGAYPGATSGDAAVFNSYLYKAGTGATATPNVTGYNVNLASISVGGYNYGATYYNTAATLTVSSLDSLTVGSFTVGIAASGKLNEFNVAGTTSTGVIASMRVTGATNFYTEGVLQVNADGVVNFPSGSSINFVGTTNYNGAIVVNGGLVTANNCPISFGTVSTTKYGGLINVVSGNMSVNGGSVLTMNGLGPQIETSGGNFYLNSSTLSTPGTTAGDNYPDVYTSAGLFQATNSTLTLNGTAPFLYNDGATQTYLGSTLNFTATAGLLETDAGTVNIGGTTTAQASTVNLGTLAAGTDGVNSAIDNYGDNFYLNAYSTINIPTVNSSAANYSIYNGGGAFVCASTSTINPSSSNAYIANNSGGAGYFALLSDANGSATIGKLGTGAKVTGQYFVQRYISTASRNYRLLTSATNTTGYTPGTASAPNAIGVNYLAQSATVQTTPTVTYPGAFVGGPIGTGGGFTAATGGPCLYLYQESILPNPANYQTSYYTGKNVPVTGLGTYLSTTSTVVASGGSGTTASDNATNDVIVPPGNGYLLYYIGNNGNTTTSPLNATSVTNVGYINQGTVPLVMWGAGTLTTALTLNSGTPGSPDYPGLTMVGNPYPSSIDLKQLYTDNTTAGAIFTNGTFGYFNTLDPTTEQFDTYGYNGSSVTTSGSNASEYVASGQGFYVTVVNANKTLTFYEDQKTSSNPAIVLESFPVTNPLATVDHIATGNNKTPDALTLPSTTSTTTPANKNLFTLSTLTAAGSAKPYIKAAITPKTPPVSADLPAATNTSPAVAINPIVTPIAGLHLKFVVDSINNDQVGIYFTPTGSDKFESSDALDLDGQSNKVYLSSYTADDKRTSINSMGNYTGGKQVKLFAKAATAGIYQIQMTDIQNFDTNDYSVFLLDKLKADSLDLTLYKSYNFNYAPGTASDSTRFVLAIEHKPVPYYALLTFAGQKVTPGVQLNWQTKNLGNKTTFILQKLTAGNVYVSIDSLQSDTSGEFNYIDQHPTLGNNTYRLEQINELGAITYSAPVTIGYNSTNPNGGLVLYPNPAKSTMTVTLTTSSTAVQVATADIYNAQGKLIEHKVVNSNSFVHDVSAYDLGVYIIQLKNSNGIIVGNSKFVKVN